ncbi:MAG: RNA polymerase factor sigma-54 [Gammaproteobacteria bacterium]|nr:MAG: RNA polymerase factor sigma-54 [Gammaproteobacteria bacterium]
MKQSLHVKMGQSLAMTPQLQQAIKLLQLSTLELQNEIQEALESNPMLEVQDEDGSPHEGDIDAETRESRESRESREARDEKREERTAANDATIDATIDASAAVAEMSTADAGDQTIAIDDVMPDVMPEELAVDSGWDDVYEPVLPTVSSAPGDGENRDFTEFHNAGLRSIQEHLGEQIRLSPLSERDMAIAETIIDAIDDNGYLLDSADSLIEGINRDETNPAEFVSSEEFESVLHLVQHLDPTGCGARDASECLAIQLAQMTPNADTELATAIVTEHLDLLAAHDFPRLRRLHKVNDDRLQSAITLIRSLNPRPGRQVISDHDEYIVPDVFVKKIKGVWRVELNPDIAPRLGINALYAGMVKRADKSEDNNFMKSHLQEARWFIKSLQSRNETLLRVATAIVERQRSFLEYGDEAMKPLVLRDIAEHLSLHESTISRVTTQKYIHTPRGIFEFKYFFSSHVSTVNGGECSATAIRAMIRKFIAAEDTAKPLSDSKIASILVDQGIQVARRTVAKYRESMAIPPSNERKRLN